jgi:membrane fusion protein (multidrug efflux system)
VIGFLQVDEGNLVGRGDATLLATVSLSNPLLVDFNISEVEYLKLTNRDDPGSRAKDVRFDLILSDNSIHTEPGIFKVLDRTVDPSTGTMKVEASFPNPSSYLRPGQFARVRVAVAEKKTRSSSRKKRFRSYKAAKTVMVVDAQNKSSGAHDQAGDKAENYYIGLMG